VPLDVTDQKQIDLAYKVVVDVCQEKQLELWSLINNAATDADGRCKNLLPPTQPLQPGTYRIHFEIAAYFERKRLQGLYPYVEIVFTVSDKEQHYHIPLLLTANGYTTYRGS